VFKTSQSSGSIQVPIIGEDFDAAIRIAVLADCLVSKADRTAIRSGWM